MELAAALVRKFQDNYGVCMVGLFLDLLMSLGVNATQITPTDVHFIQKSRQDLIVTCMTPYDSAEVRFLEFLDQSTMTCYQELLIGKELSLDRRIMDGWIALGSF